MGRMKSVQTVRNVHRKRLNAKRAALVCHGRPFVMAKLNVQRVKMKQTAITLDQECK